MKIEEVIGNWVGIVRDIDEMIEWWNLSEMEMDKMSEIWLISDEINVGYFAGGYSKVRDFVTVSAEISQQTKFKSLTYPPTKKPSNTSIKKGKIITVILLFKLHNVIIICIFLILQNNGIYKTI